MTTAYKELGLEDDSSLAPIPIKRRRRVPDSSSRSNTNVSMDNKDNHSLTNSNTNPQDAEGKGNNNNSTQDRNLVTVEQIAMKQNNREVGVIHSTVHGIKHDRTDLISVANQQNTIERFHDIVVKSEITEMENSLLHQKQENIRTETCFVGTSLENEKSRIVPNSEQDDLHILANDTELLKTKEYHSHLQPKMGSSLSPSKPGASSSSGKVFNVPGSQGMRVPTKEVLADLHKQLENGQLSSIIGQNLFP